MSSTFTSANVPSPLFYISNQLQKAMAKINELENEVIYQDKNYNELKFLINNLEHEIGELKTENNLLNMLLSSYLEEIELAKVNHFSTRNVFDSGTESDEELIHPPLDW